jgi:hypothetical protein
MKYKQANLKEAMDFKCDPIHQRLKNQGFSKKQVNAMVLDGKRFLWMVAVNPGKAFMPPEKIDTVWHCFLEFTQIYHDFCNKVLGRFIHHFPKEALPASFSNIRCQSCAAGVGPIIKPPIGISLEEQTTNVAKAMFGKISKNWSFKI